MGTPVTTWSFEIGPAVNASLTKFKKKKEKDIGWQTPKQGGIQSKWQDILYHFSSKARVLKYDYVNQ